jgi:hypothetical protein
MRIEEGRLVERECPDCGGIERRAFGEAESPRGELSSYAVGWTSGHELLVGHMTVGIGAGNPGGGSFHMEVLDNEGGPAMRLVDRPFEDVPEGGPDLTREEALAHDTLPFVWWVADEVLIQDRRANWMVHWILQTRAFATRPVVEGTEPVRHVVREKDGDWQLLCGTVEEKPQLFHLFHALDRDQSLLEVIDLPAGQRADRRRLRGWKRAPA